MRHRNLIKIFLDRAGVLSRFVVFEIEGVVNRVLFE